MRSVSLNVEDRVVCLRGADLNPDCGDPGADGKNHTWQTGSVRHHLLKPARVPRRYSIDIKTKPNAGGGAWGGVGWGGVR